MPPLHVSPYVSAAAKRAGVEVGTHADRHRIAPRNQREAGIEHLQWENRAKPVESWAKLIAMGLVGIFGLVCLMVALQGGADALSGIWPAP